MITPQDIADKANVLQIDMAALGAILQAGASRVGLARSTAKVAEARAKSAALISQAREAVQPTLDAIAAREAQHQAVIAQIESIQGEFAAMARTDVPDFDAMIAQIV